MGFILLRSKAILSTNLTLSQLISQRNVGKIVTSASTQFGKRNRVGPWAPVAQYTSFQNQLNSISVHDGWQNVSIKIAGSRNLDKVLEGWLTIYLPGEVTCLQSCARSIEVEENIGPVHHNAIMSFRGNWCIWLRGWCRSCR